MLAGYDIVCLGLTNWNTLWTRKQYFMDLLARHGSRVLYVEPAHSPLTKWVHPHAGITATLAQHRLAVAKPNLWVWSPPTLLPAPRRISLSNWINHRVLGVLLPGVMRQLGMATPILWVYNPLSGALCGKDLWKVVVYDCTDEHRAFPRTNATLVDRCEHELMRRSDVVLVSAPPLLESRRAKHGNVHLVPNGVDTSVFAPAREGGTSEPPDLAPVPRPIIGYVGVVGEWFDIDLLAYLAQARPHWSFVLIGPVFNGVDVSSLLAFNNIHAFGPRSRESLPGYLSAFDVCINPFKRTELTESVNPLKIYEYLSAGRPTVSVDLPAIKALGDVVHLAASPGEFLAAVEEALAEDGPRWARRRALAVEQYSWENLVETACKIVERSLGSNASNVNV